MQGITAEKDATLTLANLTFGGGGTPHFLYCKGAHAGAEFAATTPVVLKC